MTKESVFQQLLAAGWPLLVGTDRLAAMFGKSENAIRIDINRSQFPIATRLSGRKRFASLADVAEFLAEKAPESSVAEESAERPRRRGRPRKGGL